MEEEASLDFRLRQIDEARNYLSDEINCNNLMIEEYKKTCKYINCVEHLLILVSAMTGCVSISAFVSLVCVGIISSEVGIEICAITAGIKKYKPIINKKKQKHNQIVYQEKLKLNTIRSCNVLRKYNDMKEKIKKSLNFCGIYYKNMADISKQTCEIIDIETIVNNDGIFN